MPWWDQNQDEFFDKSPRCKACVTHPILRQNGDGYNLKCPVCNKVYIIKDEVNTDDEDEYWGDKGIFGGFTF